MAHEIDTTTGRAAVFTVGTPPWHRLGVTVADAQTSEQAIRLAALDWTVEQWPLVARRNGTDRDVPDRVANVRTDTGAVLGVVSTSYRVFQNKSAFDFFDAIVQERLAIFETAGALKGGRHIWMLARLPKTLRAAGEDEIRPYVLLANSHDGTRALRMIPTTIRVVCANTLNLALGRVAVTEGLTIFHNESLERRVADAREKLGIITRRVDEFGDQVQALARRPMSRDELTSYFTGLVTDRAADTQKRMLAAFVENLDHPTNTLPGTSGTAWAAYNAVSQWADHQSVVRGQSEVLRADSRLHSVWFGAAAEFKARAFDAAVALAV
jgi:phage/plasmid-like protein (TIGR03299 family)